MLFPAFRKNGTRTVVQLYTTILFSLGLGVFPLSAHAFGPQSSTKATEWGFDFVEEFDGLQNWSPNYSGCCGYVWENSYMPKLANGGNSAWTFYSGDTSTGTWIGGAPDGKQVWRGTKSASIDMGGPAPSKGPTRLGVYFGNPANPAPASGYSDFRVFYMVWIPENHFPTSCTNGCSTTDTVGIYTNNQPYAYYAYYKLGNANHGCNGLTCPYNSTYGEIVTVFSILKNNYTSPSGAAPGLFLASSNRGQTLPVYARSGPSNLDSKMGGWFGVEFWIRNNPDNTGSLTDVWTYDQLGRSEHVLADNPYTFGSSAAGMNWDYFVLGGNKVYDYGDTMNSTYFVDDFIVDNGNKGQIGPRYFNAIGVTAALPDTPPNFSGRMITR